MINVEAVGPDTLQQQGTTSARLISHLFALANNNHRFQRGTKDKVGFTITEGDRQEDSNDFESPVCDFFYEFTAQRLRTPGERPCVAFTFSINGDVTPSEIPKHVVRDVFGTDEEDADQNITGDVTLRRTLEFLIDTTDRKLKVCDRLTYLDEEGTKILENCSCPPDEDEVFYVTGSVLGGDGGGSDTVLESSTQQVAMSTLRERLERESLSLVDVDEAKRLWVDADSIDEALQTEIDHHNLLLACWTFNRLKDALQALAGPRL